MLYGYEANSLKLREERRLRVFENRILMRIFGPKRNENGPIKSRGLRWVGFNQIGRKYECFQNVNR